MNNSGFDSQNAAPAGSGMPSATQTPGKQSGEEKSYFHSLYEDTMRFFAEHHQQNPVFPAALRLVQSGSTQVKVSRRYLLKAIDETWVKAIEESLLSLDSAVRKPSRFLEECEEVLPIELSTNINNRSIVDLAQHAEYINDIDDDGMVIPSKILNSFNEETMNTYENRFLNTLIQHLYDFVEKRYNQAKKSGMDEKVTAVSLRSQFQDGKISGDLHISLTMTQPPEEGETIGKNIRFSAELWQRVERLHDVVSSYVALPFVLAMDKRFVRPPIQRTNAILKNRDLQQCLALWEFIQTYEKVGYDMISDEQLETMSEDYLAELQNTLSLQYMIFRYKIEHCTDEGETLAYADSEIISPVFVDKPEEVMAEDYNVYDSYYHRLIPVSQLAGGRTPSEDEWRIRQAVDLALAAEEVLQYAHTFALAQQANQAAAALSDQQTENSPQEAKEIAIARAKAARATQLAQIHLAAAEEAEKQAALTEILGRMRQAHENEIDEPATATATVANTYGDLNADRFVWQDDELLTLDAIAQAQKTLLTQTETIG